MKRASKQTKHDVDNNDTAPEPLDPSGDSDTVKPIGRRKRTGVAAAVEWAIIVGLALSVALLVRATVVQTFYIPTVSMVPTLAVDDRLLVDKVTLQTREIRRGDIIVFARPASFTDKTIKDLIKRVIGLPGDTVEGHDGAVWINGKQLRERYLKPTVKTSDFAPVRVGVDNYFVMGDNRPDSYDSRFWGTVEREKVVGRALIRIWPPGRIGSI